MEKVSVIIPILNEERNIAELVDALSKQDYPKDYLEFLFVDGGSTDKSKEMIRDCCVEKQIEFRILDNVNKTAPNAFNLGMKEAQGAIIVILSAHSIYKHDYIRKCVNGLLDSGADNVGGRVKTVGRGNTGRCIAAVLTSWFGAGSTDFKFSNETKYVDTVPFGTFRKSLVERIGDFNVELPRSEDNEFNYRIRKNGGKILLLSDVEITYFCRETVKELIKMGFANGKGVGYTAIRYPEVLKLKYFIPMLFTGSIVILTLGLVLPLPALHWLFITEILTYLICDLYFTLKTETSLMEKVKVFWLFPLFHVSYGLGTMKGIMTALTKR